MSTGIAVEAARTQAVVAAGQEARALRDALGRYSTGVALITTQTPHGPVGLAVNSFTSVSLAPPLISFCAMHTSASWSDIRATGRFAVSVLQVHHEQIARRFSQRGIDRFAGSTWIPSPGGHPILGEALSWFDATIETVTTAGDHEVVIAGVDAFSEPGEGAPLVFFGGRYGGWAV